MGMYSNLSDSIDGKNDVLLYMSLMDQKVLMSSNDLSYYVRTEGR